MCLRLLSSLVEQISKRQLLCLVHQSVSISECVSANTETAPDSLKMEFKNIRNYGQSKCNICGDIKLDGTKYVELCVGCKLQVHCDCGYFYASHLKGWKFYCAQCLWMPPPGRVTLGTLKWPPAPPNAGTYNFNLEYVKE